MPEVSKIGKSIMPRNVAMDGLDMNVHYSPQSLLRVAEDNGIFVPDFVAHQMFEIAHAMDTYPTIQQPLTTPSVTTLVQFLQNWLPGLVKILTAARKADELLGVMTVGSWEDEEVVQPILENTGVAVPYNDGTNVPLANWNLNYAYRTVIRFEEGIRVTRLEEARAARQQVNSAEMKRESAVLNLEIQRNAVAFYGYNSGNNSTYGFLNELGLPAYVEVASNGTTTNWSGKTFLEICADIRTALQTLRTNSQDTIEPGKTPITLGIATAVVDYLSTTSDYGISVWGWLKETYGESIRVVSAPQLNSAYSSDNVFYAFAETVADLSSDDRRTFIQVVPAKFQSLGVEQMAKGFEEDYANATAGCMLKRPYAVVRFYGI